jgi:uncharacterized protein with GYD domain
MTRCLALLTFTEQGLRNVQHSAKRAAAFRETVENSGGKVLAQYWTLGEADGCVVFEAPDEETAGALLLALAQAGNVRTRTLRVYDEHEFARMVSKS